MVYHLFILVADGSLQSNKDFPVYCLEIVDDNLIVAGVNQFAIYNINERDMELKMNLLSTKAIEDVPTPIVHRTPGSNLPLKISVSQCQSANC